MCKLACKDENTNSNRRTPFHQDLVGVLSIQFEDNKDLDRYERILRKFQETTSALIAEMRKIFRERNSREIFSDFHKLCYTRANTIEGTGVLPDTFLIEWRWYIIGEQNQQESYDGLAAITMSIIQIEKDFGIALLGLTDNNQRIQTICDDRDTFLEEKEHYP